MSRGWRGVAEKVMPEAVRGRAGPAFGRTMDRLRVPPTGLRAGPHVGGADRDRRPVVLVLLPGAGAAEVERVARALAVAARSPGAARPVLLVDGPFFAPARRAGICVEYLPDERTWSRRHPDRSYTADLARRLDLLRRDYATDQLLRLAADGTVDAQRLAPMLRPPARSWWRRRWLPLALRAEGAIDRPSSGA
jgi:hypothetical protein